MVWTFVFNVQIYIDEPGYLHCFLNGLITVHLREEVTGRGEDSDWADWFWIYLVLWCMVNKVFVTAEMSLQLSRGAGWNTDDELMYSYGVSPLLVNSRVGNSCYFLASLQYFTVEPQLLNAGSKSIEHDQRAALPLSSVFPSPLTAFLVVWLGGTGTDLSPF